MVKRTHDALILKSHLINALLPKFLRHIFWNAVIFMGLFVVYLVIDRVFSLGYQNELIFYGIVLTLVFSLIKVTKDLIEIMNTEFRFYAHHVEQSFSFFKQVSHSINYSQITDIHVKKDVWDRLCKVGDVVIHTGNDIYHEGGKHFTIRDIKYPDKLKEQISQRIHKLS